ncbi:zinc-binding alcohol dehydrogenase [Aquabacterium soli]|uniref:Zinc-binding alcohol dehydrogenase n=1 Tax=Aquabacterium soli TaxID=2493092 RepID=A0A426V5Z9_9BURK|nr:zinc-binding alcohol dehydrogenase [Aquabacterium soli]
MSVAEQLFCLAPGHPATFALQLRHVPQPGPGQVLVRVKGSSVNPIDAKRSTGYGRRVLALKGAARFPAVLGNDFAGVVQATGAGVTACKPGDRVFGLVPTGAHGAHASQVLADARYLRAAPANHTHQELAALPYTFTTLWLALRSVGLNQHNAKDKEVLVHGASGGLGQLSLQVLSRWGARVTAVCSTAHVQRCKDLGATVVVDRTRRALSTLPTCYDATLNFAIWQDERALVSRLKPGAMGHATTVHPLLDSMDVHGWFKGGWRVYRAWSAMRGAARAAGGRGTRYAWTIFQPSTEALHALEALLLANVGLHLPIGLIIPIAQGEQAFAHVAQQRPGRAILMPE